MTDTPDTYRRATPDEDTDPGVGSRVTALRNHGDDAPQWFQVWLAAEFKPFREEVRGKLKFAQYAKYAGAGAMGVLVIKFPELAKQLGPIIAAVLGGG